MENEAMRDYISRYFKANGADIIHQDDSRLQVKLTEALDKELINRPFYWQYVKNTGGAGDPMTLTFLTSPKEAEKGEHLHFGAPRLHQIFRSARKTGKWTLLYESKAQAQQPSPLFPWLVVNVKYSFVSHQRKDQIVSYGLQLIHGQFVENMMNHLSGRKLRAVIADHSFPMASLIQIPSGVLRIKRYAEKKVQAHSEDWAEKAWQRMEEEFSILDAYYQSSQHSQEVEYEREKKAIRSRYHPHINIDIINSGIFYLNDSSL